MSRLHFRHNPGSKVCKLHCPKTQIRSVSGTFAKSVVLLFLVFFPSILFFVALLY